LKRGCRYPIWQHSIFSDPAYLSIKMQVHIIALECSSMLTLICYGSAAKLKLRNTILPTHSSNIVHMHFNFKPRFGYKSFFFSCSLFLLLLPLVITFLPHCHYFLLHDDKRTSERVNERTSGNFSLLTSWSSFAYHY
jgi:hypothetical protein